MLLPELQNVVCTFSAVSFAQDEPGRVELLVTGQYRGPSIFIQARLGASSPILAGLEAVSVESQFPSSDVFQPFSIMTGGLGWQPLDLDEGTHNLLGRLVETDGAGTIFGELASCTEVLTITSPAPPPVVAGFQNVTFAFSDTDAVANEGGAVRLTINGEYRGPATFVQARLGGSDPLFTGIEAVSFERSLLESPTEFRSFELTTGNLRWDAFQFQAGDTFSLLGRLVETDGAGGTIRQVEAAIQPFMITSGFACQLDNNRAEIIVNDNVSTRPLLTIGDPDNTVFISSRDQLFRLGWPVRNQGTRTESVRIRVQCLRKTFLGGVPRFSVLDTINGQDVLVLPNEQKTLNVGVVLANFNCDFANDYSIEMISDDCPPRVGQSLNFQIEIGQLATTMAGGLGSAHGFQPALVGAGRRGAF